MRTKNLTLSRDEFPVVTSLDNLEVGRIYRTSKHSILKHLPFNRGIKEGYLPERVAEINKKIDNDTFLFRVNHVMLNLKGLVIDGNNRLKALKDKNLPVNFMINDEPRFNQENPSDILNEVSEFNAVNSMWFGKDAYKSALAFSEPAAKAIDEVKNWVEGEYGISDDIFTPSRLIALALKDKSGLAGKIQPRRAYCNQQTADVINSDEFKATIKFISEVIKFVQSDNSSITEWFVIRCLMPTIWKKELSLRIVLANVKKRGFSKMDNTKMVGVKARVNEMLKMIDK